MSSAKEVINDDCAKAVSEPLKKNVPNRVQKTNFKLLTALMESVNKLNMDNICNVDLNGYVYVKAFEQALSIDIGSSGEYKDSDINKLLYKKINRTRGSICLFKRPTGSAIHRLSNLLSILISIEKIKKITSLPSYLRTSPSNYLLNYVYARASVLSNNEKFERIEPSRHDEQEIMGKVELGVDLLVQSLEKIIIPLSKYNSLMKEIGQPKVEEIPDIDEIIATVIRFRENEELSVDEILSENTSLIKDLVDNENNKLNNKSKRRSHLDKILNEIKRQGTDKDQDNLLKNRYQKQTLDESQSAPFVKTPPFRHPSDNYEKTPTLSQNEESRTNATNFTGNSGVSGNSARKSESEGRVFFKHHYSTNGSISSEF